MHAPFSRDGADPASDAGAARLWGGGQPLRLGVAGAGPRAAELAAAVADCPDARLAGVTDGAVARELGAFGVAVAPDLDELLDGVDAVVVAGRLDERLDAIGRALERGRHVLAASPLARTSAGVRAHAARARERGLALGFADAPRYDDGHQALRARVRAGGLGALRTLETVRATRDPADVLWELAPRELAAVVELRGVPDSISAQAAANRGDDAPTTATLVLRWSGGFVARVVLKQGQLVELRRTSLVARRGTVVCEDGVVSDWSEDPDPARVPAPLPAGAPASRARESARAVADFVECAGSGAEPLGDPRAALDVVRLVELAAASLARGGEAVPVPAS